MADAEAPKRKSDLGIRALSAVVMLAVAGTALWLGSLTWGCFTLIVGLVGFGEFARLVWKGFTSKPVRVIGILAAIPYFGIPIDHLSSMPFSVLYHGDRPNGGLLVGLGWTISVVGIVVSTDIGAYFAGRTIGGPKIAPSISPSKTWAGLAGGMIAAGLWAIFAIGLPNRLIGESASELTATYSFAAFASGAVLAVVAQMGDFFESWLKRRAGVKDSSNLIPGHGGVFDRIDGLLPVVLVTSFAADWLIFGELVG